MQVQEATETGAVLVGLLILGLALFLIWNISTLLFGILFILAGIFIIIKFPWATNYQHVSFTRTGVLFGIILIIIGLLIVFM